MALHDFEFHGQIPEHRIFSNLANPVRTALEDAAGIISARSGGGVANMRVYRGERVARVSAMRAVPGLIDGAFGDNGQGLRPAARGPNGQVFVSQDLLRAAPGLTIDLAPILEIAGEKRAERPWF